MQLRRLVQKIIENKYAKEEEKRREEPRKKNFLERNRFVNYEMDEGGNAEAKQMHHEEKKAPAQQQQPVKSAPKGHESPDELEDLLSLGDDKPKKEERKGQQMQQRPPTGGSLAGSQPQEEQTSFEKSKKGQSKASPNVSRARV